MLEVAETITNSGIVYLNHFIPVLSDAHVYRFHFMMVDWPTAGILHAQPGEERNDSRGDTSGGGDDGPT